MDAPPRNWSRGWLLKGGLLLLLSCTIVAGLYMSYTRNAVTKIDVIHTVSYSNAAAFLLIADHGDRISDRFVPDPAKHVESLLAASGPAVSITPFSNALIAMSRNEELVIISGSGINGLSLLSNAGPSLDDLSNKEIGTARGDSLEVFAYEAMTRLYTSAPRPFEFRYFTDPIALQEAAAKKEIDAATHVEPFATALVDRGLVRILTSAQLWGDHPDAVVLTTRSIIKQYEADLEWLIHQLRVQQDYVIHNPKESARKLSSFYDMKPSELERILQFQRPEVDIRRYDAFFSARIKTLQEMNYIDHPPESDRRYDWRFLQ